jgi:uncharacterized protein
VKTQQIILDTNVLVSAFVSSEGAPRQVLRKLLLGEATALISQSLYMEYCDVLGRRDFLERCPLDLADIDGLFDAFLASTQMVSVFYMWRPNLRDEGDNHVFELAVAAGSAPLLTYNARDFAHPQLKFPNLQILSPAQWLQTTRS